MYIFEYVRERRVRVFTQFLSNMMCMIVFSFSIRCLFFIIFWYAVHVFSISTRTHTHEKSVIGNWPNHLNNKDNSNCGHNLLHMMHFILVTAFFKYEFQPANKNVIKLEKVGWNFDQGLTLTTITRFLFVTCVSA